MRVLAFGTLVVAALGAGAVTAPGPAQAAEKPRHCVVDVSAANPQQSCDGSFTTAITKATKGRITDAPADVRKAMRDPKLIAELNTPAANAVLGVEYLDSGFGGDSVVFTAPTGCTPSFDDIDWQVPSLGDLDDQIMSYRAFSGCWVKHWEHPNHTGLSIGFDSGRADMGELAGKASSIQWT